MRWYRFLLCLLLLLPARMSSAAPAREAFRNLVNIGDGRHINMIWRGKSGPTVIFLQGAGAGLFSWRKVWDDVGTISRACLYDRAGFGYSDPSPKPGTALNVTDDLHALLRAAKISRPVVLVGHSLGGLFATMYADRFPADVAGMVLVDPSFAGQFDMPISARGHQEYLDGTRKSLDFLGGCAALARAGQLSPTDPHGCFTMHKESSSAQIAYQEYQFLNPAYYESGASELRYFLLDPQSVSRDGRQEAAMAHAFGKLPLRVLTSGIVEPDPNKSDADNEMFAEHWRRGHEALAQRSRRGLAITVPGARHAIQMDQPQAVLAAIRSVVEQARHTQ